MIFMATKIGKKTQVKIDVILKTARAMQESGMMDEPYGTMYWTGYVRAIEQIQRILDGRE